MATLKAEDAADILQAPQADSPEKSSSQAGAIFDNAQRPGLAADETGDVSTALPALGVLAAQPAINPAHGAYVARDPSAFKELARRLLDAMSKPSRLAVLSHAARQRSDISTIESLQAKFRGPLLAQSSESARRLGLPEDRVVTHGTTLKGLLGMIFSGAIEATNPYPGFRGERADLWGAYGIENGAKYGATRGVGKALPGVSLLLYNEDDPIVVKDGETMNRRPLVEQDFMAAVVTDGETTIVIPMESLRALAASAQEWRKAAVALAQKGKWRDFEEWERFRNALDPEAGK